MDIESFSQYFSQIGWSTPSLGGYISFTLACILLVCSGFVSASENAFFSLSPVDKNEIEDERHYADKYIIRLLRNSERLLATILICNNLVNVAIITLFNYFFIQLIDFGEAIFLEFLFMTVILTFLLLLFGEIMPKIYSNSHSLAFCRFAAPMLCRLSWFFHPLSSLLMGSRLITDKIADHRSVESLTVDDLEQALELTDKKEIAEESSMLQGIIRFGGEMAKEVMTPRVDLVDLEMRTPFNEVLSCVVENNYSRIPVYEGSEDNIKGVLYTKDLLPHLNKPNNFRWQTLIRQPYFVPETKMIDDLLRDFQKQRKHIAIVVDEFGGTSGIVTMEDILEEIVGEISDEYDDEERSYQRLNHNTYVFEGKTLLTDFVRVLELDDEFFANVEGDADTLAGLLLEIKGDFPQLDEKICYENFTFQATEMDRTRIIKVKVIMHSRGE